MTRLTQSLKNDIDKLSYSEMLSKWRFSPTGAPIFEGESGEYFKTRMAEIKPENHSQISKKIGW